MNNYELISRRLHNQQLTKHKLHAPREIVSWMGAMQAQDYNMAKWGIGVRLTGITAQQVEDAVNNGDIIRTHIMRPTWHFVSTEDIHWLMQLTAPRIKPILFNYDKNVGFEKIPLRKVTDIVIKSLQGNKHLTRLELGKIINDAGIAITNDQVGHVLFHAELDRIVCNGRVINKKQTYGLLEEKVPDTGLFDKDEALGKLAAKYFGSHGPATLQDFVWWSGLLLSEAKRAIEIIKPDFIFEEINSQTYIYSDAEYIHLSKNRAYLLPAFDEILVSYKDRKEAVCAEYHPKVMTSNGIFRPFILYNNQVIGSWKKQTSKNKTGVETEFFIPISKILLKAVDMAIEGFVNYSS
ncbi:MAG: winged helix DNA-binding domain-containing protein [Prevotellaceae bacterium]|jgi:hypothetical protein|nr:winged helix DNA-binding domain-containing protein [Prevotellaceae bacterium]